MFEWIAQTKIIQGQNTLSRAAVEMTRSGGSRAVVVTDKGVSEAGLAQKVVEALGDACAGVFDDVPQDTGFDVVDSVGEFAISRGADAVISVGGGSVIDTSKVLSILLKEGGKAEDHAGLYVLKRRGVPHVAIPTTTGTGSEVTAVSVVLDRKQGKKVYYLSEHLSPNSAILDPTTTLGLPPLLTASTGMDAITHAIEAVVSKLKNPLSTALALRAIKTIVENLPICVKNGSDINARETMQVAATMAGIAFASTQVGMVHAISHSAGAICRVPHGVGNGIMLPPVMRFNTPHCVHEMAEVAIAMGIDRGGRSDEEIAGLAAGEVEKLLADTDHPQRLSEVGVKDENVSPMAALSMTDPAGFTNPVRISEQEQIEKLIREVL